MKQFFLDQSWLAFKIEFEKLPMDWFGGSMNKAEESMTGENKKIMNTSSC